MALVRTQVQFVDEQHRWLKQYAVSKGVSLSEALREMVDHYRAQFEKARILEGQKKRAMSVVGKFSSKT